MESQASKSEEGLEGLEGLEAKLEAKVEEVVSRRQGRSYRMSEGELAGLNWSESTAQELARSTGMSVNWVRLHARRLGKQLASRPRVAAPRASRAGEMVQYQVADWSQVDWRQSNVEIAAQLGVSRQRVHQKRASIAKREKESQ